GQRVRDPHAGGDAEPGENPRACHALAREVGDRPGEDQEVRAAAADAEAHGRRGAGRPARPVRRVGELVAHEVRAPRERRAHGKYMRESPKPPAAMRGGRTAAMVDPSFSTGAGAQPRKAASASLTSAGRSIGTKWPAPATVRSVPAGRRRIASAAPRSPEPGLSSPRMTRTGAARRSRKAKPSLRGAFA